jgi:general secretion pathway protein F
MLTEFAYNSLDPSGNESRGTISADDRIQAISILKSRGLTVTDLAEKKAKRSGGFVLRKNFNDTDIYNVARELSTLLRSGMRIDKAFELLIHATTKESLKEVLATVLSDIKAGKGVAQAFDNTGRFNPLFISMIRISEAVGELQTAFENVAQYLRFQIQFKAEIRNALTYPVFLIFASGVTFFVIFQFIVPRFFSIFGSTSSQLPLPAKILYAISGWFTFKTLAIIAGVVAIFFIAKKLYPARLRLLNIGNYLIYIPGVRRLILDLELSRFSYSMFAVLQSGVEFIKALKLSASLIQNEHYRAPIASLVGQIKEGRKIADVFSQVHFLPEIYFSMVRVGEESGNLKDMFFELYQIFDERFKNGIKRVLILVEPLIIIVMGLIVGFIVITLILTVMSVSSIKL